MATILRPALDVRVPKNRGPSSGVRGKTLPPPPHHIKKKHAPKGTRDAAALPHNADAHEARLEKGLWGKKAYRLAPATFVADSQDGTALIKEHGNSGGMASIKVKTGLILDWYEGLLVLEELNRRNENEDACAWVTELRETFQKEKSQRNISASLYVSKKLLNAAVTGPNFVTREASVGRGEPL